MSYCVNCGVKLKESEKVCPLCNTKVINPNNLKTDFIPAYSQNIEKTKKVNKKYLCFLITIILMGVTIITVLCNLIFTGNITWSIYVVASILFLNSKLSILTPNEFSPFSNNCFTKSKLPKALVVRLQVSFACLDIYSTSSSI